LDYFLQGQWERDLLDGQSPILVPPKSNLVAKINDVWELNQGRTPPPSQGLFFLCTSGSTGSPKLIAKTKDLLEKEAAAWLSPDSPLPYKDKEGIKILVSVPLTYIYGLLWGLVLKKESWTFVYDKNLQECDVAITTPHQISIWKREGKSLPPLVISSGSKFPVALALELRTERKTKVFEVYGSTESGAIGYRDPCWKARYLLLSEVQSNISLHGTLLIESPWCSTWSSDGDLKSEGQPYDTNDACEISDTGILYLGRIDRIVKIYGKRISLDEIESQIRERMVQADFAIIALGQDTGVVTLIGLYREPIDFLKRWLEIRTHIPPSLAKVVWKKIESWPLLENGKIDYQSLIQRYSKRDFVTSSWEDFLLDLAKTKDKGFMEKNLIEDLGWDSIEILELILEVENKLGKVIPQEERNTSLFRTLGGILTYIQEIERLDESTRLDENPIR